MLEDIAKETGRLPQALAERPSLPLHLQIYLDTFYELSPRRQHSMGSYLPLSFSDVKSYLDEYEYESRELRSRMFHHIMQLDHVFLEDRAKRAQEATKLDKGAKR